MFGKFTVIWTVLYVSSVFSKPVCQRFSSVSDVNEIVFLTETSVNHVFCFTVATIFQFNSDVLVGVGESRLFPYVFAKYERATF